jgi:NitT/TauT family transport system ATP-binding protein
MKNPITSAVPLPHVPLGRLFGLVEAMAETPGPDDLFRLAGRLSLQLDELLPLVEAAQLLAWARVEHGDYNLTEEGRRIAEGSLAERKALFRERVRTLPLVSAVLEALAHRKRVSRETIAARLRGQLGAVEAEKQLDTAINWGRWAELLDYDSDEACFLRAPGASRG